MNDKARKAAIAQRIQDLLKRESFGGLPLDDVEGIEVHAVTPLITSIRVKTFGMGAHHYEVKVSEPW